MVKDPEMKMLFEKYTQMVFTTIALVNSVL
jgi:hypothetical protein